MSTVVYYQAGYYRVATSLTYLELCWLNLVSFSYSQGLELFTKLRLLEILGLGKLNTNLHKDSRRDCTASQ